MAAGEPLLAGEDGPVAIFNGTGRSPVLLVCEHAGRRIPAALGTLGLDAAELDRHIAWDLGAEAVARRLSDRLDAPLVAQRYSRLVYDCNRPPEAPDAIPATSELTPIPGNQGLTPEQRTARAEALYRPFHAAVAGLIDERRAGGIETVLVTLHSFTAVFRGERRNLDIGILHDRDARLADRLLEALASPADLVVRRNQPYGPEHGVTHTLVKHALPRGLLNVMIEVRNDLIHDAAGQSRIAERLAEHLNNAVAELVADAVGAGRSRSIT